jgi:hypothetical protein
MKILILIPLILLFTLIGLILRAGYRNYYAVDRVFPGCPSWKKRKTIIVYKNKGYRGAKQKFGWFDSFTVDKNTITVFRSINKPKEEREAVRVRDIIRIIES